MFCFESYTLANLLRMNNVDVKAEAGRGVREQQL